MSTSILLGSNSLFIGGVIMSTPGIGDPHWYEWFVGLKYAIEMLNPDSGITCVVFQHGEYNTIDDVVVEY